jgi:Asp-tRNA(Asn)/Glu-tRNA(Gln) amidotransferase A subunit family amidase
VCNFSSNVCPETQVSSVLIRRSNALLAVLAACHVMVLASAPARAQQTRATPFDIHEATITDLQASLEARRVTSVELVDAYLARIAAYDQQAPALNSMIRLNPRARTEAAALDAERARRGSRGPLHGVPVILKDNFDTHDMPTTAGSIALADAVPPDDAFVVKRLREAGAIILGKANMHELAAGITTVSSLGGQTRNPYDPRRCPGGSSGGTGAAIAASFAAVGWGTDTCGSIRIPAAFGSLVGLRPTQGLVSRDGIVPLSHTQDIGGPMARTVTDLAIALDATIGPDPNDPMTRVLEGRALPKFTDSLRADALRGARLGVLTSYFRDTDNEVARVSRAALDSMKAHGAEVIEVRIPGFDSLIQGTRAVDFETKSDLMTYLAATPSATVRSAADILASGLHHTTLQNRLRVIDSAGAVETEGHRAALARQVLVRQVVESVLETMRLDALVYPTMRQKPTLIGEPQAGGTCQLSAQTGLPALTTPAGFTRDGLPVGIEFLGRGFADARLVALAYAFERTGPRRRPPSTTPPLVNGRPPAPMTFEVVATTSSATARARLTYDAPRNELAYDVRVGGVPADQVLAVVLRSGTADRPGPVVHRLVGPGATTGSGVIPLTGGDREMLLEGRWLLGVFAGGHPPAHAPVARSSN